MLALLVSIVLGADVREPRAAVVQVHDFAKLTQTATLVGKPAHYRIELDSLSDEYNGFTLCDCKTADPVFRSVWLYQGQEIEDKMIVEAVLVILHHPTTIGDAGTVFPGHTEFRLTKAVRRFDKNHI